MEFFIRPCRDPGPVLQRLGGRHAMTVYGLEGLDEIS